MNVLAREWVRARARAYELLKDFNPSQPRDEHGRWTDGGGNDDAPSFDIDKVEAKTKLNVEIASDKAKKEGHKPLPGSEGEHPATIASRNPTAKGTKKNPAPPSGYGQPDTASMKLDPERYDHDIAIFGNPDFYPNFRKDVFDDSTDGAVDNIVGQMKDNLKFLYQYADKSTEIWYDGARALVDDRAKLWGFNDASVAAVYAALSPTKDWDQNVHIADMLLQTYKNQQGTVWSDEMDEKSKTLWSKANQKVVDLVRGKTLGELTSPAEKALWIRTYDETHNKAEYRTVLPNGALGKVVKNKDGTPSKVVWQSLPSITNAVKALEANGDREIISAAMGTAHKVRSFYNNILDPHSKNGDVTIDTHAVGAALLRQLSSNTVAVSHNFGNTPMKVDQPEGWEAVGASSKTGLSGLYPVYAQAYREAAKELGIQPRQLQSAVWVVKRDTFGNLSKKDQEAVEALWHSYHDDHAITLEQTRSEVAKILGLGKHERHYRIDEAGRRPGDARELHRNRVGPAAAGMDRRAGAGAAGTAAGLDAVRGEERRAGAEELRAFDESEHPRDSHGRFTDSGGGDELAPSPAQNDPWKLTASGKNIKGLPSDIVIKDHLMGQAQERGAWEMTAKEQPKDGSGRADYNVEIRAKIPEGIEPFVNRPGKDENRPDRVWYYDPKLATLETTDKGVEYLERTYARPREGLAREIEPLPEKDVIYRGMRAEEYAKFLETGEITSTGHYNLEGQEGLTYWATDPATAASYSNGFAPWPHKATFEQPAYVVATKMPKETRKVAGTGENEVGVARTITKDEIVGVWRGDVFQHSPGDQDISPSSYDPNESVYKAGSGSGPSSDVVWQKVELAEGGNQDGQEATAEGRGEASRGGGRAGAGSPEEAQRRAAQAASGHAKLEGLPDKPLKVGDAWYVPGPYGKARETAERYMRDAGLPYDPPRQFQKVDKARATRIANEFDQMKHDPDDPKVKASYEALADETIAQWQAIKQTGLKVEWIKPGDPDPYAASPRLAAMDVIDNNHWWGFPTEAGFGSGDILSDNPMLRMTEERIGGRQLMVNDVFRIVHDYFGHFKEGVGFRADGEENAWRAHASMFSELARGAMTAETRGQNSWVNYGPHGETNRTATASDTVFAPQKVGLMSQWTQQEGRTEKQDRELLARLFNEADHPRDEHGRWTDGGGDDVSLAPSRAEPTLHKGPLPSQSIALTITTDTAFKGETVEVLVNPTASMASSLMRSEGKPQQLRYMTDNSRNLYAWLAKDAIHFEVGESLNAVSSQKIKFDKGVDGEDAVAGGKLHPAFLLLVKDGQDNAKKYAEKNGLPFTAEPDPEKEMLFVSEMPNQAKIDRWTGVLNARSEALAAEGQAGNAEDDQIAGMLSALAKFSQEDDILLKNNDSGLNAVYDSEMKLQAAAFSYVRNKIATISSFGALDHAAGVKALTQAGLKYANKIDQIEGTFWGDDAATRAMYEAAGYKQRGETEGGITTMVKTELPGGGMTKARAELQRRAEAVAKKFDFDPSKIEYTNEVKEFELGGVKYKYAGSYTFGEPGIKLYMTQLNADNIKGVTAHEIGHRKFEMLRNQHKIQTEIMMQDPGPPPDPNHKYWWGKKGGAAAIMNPMGEMRPPYDKKYPLVHEWAQIQNMRPSLEQDDGMTDYSKSYWKEWEKGEMQTNIAYHETIAEMARLEDKFGKEVFVKNAGAGWRKMYAMMEKVWTKTEPWMRDMSMNQPIKAIFILNDVKWEVR